MCVCVCVCVCVHVRTHVHVCESHIYKLHIHFLQGLTYNSRAVYMYMYHSSYKCGNVHYTVQGSNRSIL